MLPSRRLWVARAVVKQGRLHEAEALAIRGLETSYKMRNPAFIVQAFATLSTEIWAEFGRSEDCTLDRIQLAAQLILFMQQFEHTTPQVHGHLRETAAPILAQFNPAELEAIKHQVAKWTLDTAVLRCLSIESY